MFSLPLQTSTVFYVITRTRHNILKICVPSFGEKLNLYGSELIEILSDISNFLLKNIYILNFLLKWKCILMTISIDNISYNENKH